MRKFKYSIIASIILSIALVACGGDNGTSANDDVEKSSSSSEKVSSSSVIPASSGNRPSSSSKSHKPPLRGVACFAPRRGCYCQRLNDAGFLFVQAIVD